MPRWVQARARFEMLVEVEAWSKGDAILDASREAARHYLVGPEDLMWNGLVLDPGLNPKDTTDIKVFQVYELAGASRWLVLVSFAAWGEGYADEEVVPQLCHPHAWRAAFGFTPTRPPGVRDTRIWPTELLEYTVSEMTDEQKDRSDRWN